MRRLSVEARNVLVRPSVRPFVCLSLFCPNFLLPLSLTYTAAAASYQYIRSVPHLSLSLFVLSFEGRVCVFNPIILRPSVVVVVEHRCFKRIRKEEKKKKTGLRSAPLSNQSWPPLRFFTEKRTFFSHLLYVTPEMVLLSLSLSCIICTHTHTSHVYVPADYGEDSVPKFRAWPFLNVLTSVKAV